MAELFKTMAEEILKMGVLNDIYREDFPVITREITCNNNVNDTAMLHSFINPPKSFMRKFMNIIYPNNFSRRKIQFIGPDHTYIAKQILFAYIQEKLTNYSIVIFIDLNLLSRNDTIEQAIYNQYINMKFNIMKENVRYILDTYNETILIILHGLQNKPHIHEFMNNETLMRCNVIVTTSSYKITSDYQLVEIRGLTDDAVGHFVQRSLISQEYIESILNLMASNFDLPYKNSPMLLKTLCTIVNCDTSVLQMSKLTRADIIFCTLNSLTAYLCCAMVKKAYIVNVFYLHLVHWPTKRKWA